MSFNQEKFDELKTWYKDCIEADNRAFVTSALVSKLNGYTGGFVGCPQIAEELPLEAHMAALVLAGPVEDADLQEFCSLYGLTTAGWFQVTDPEPTTQRLNAQFGVHVEECAEMFPEITSDNEDLNAKMRLAKTLLDEIGAEFKAGRATLQVVNKGKFFDSLLDQRVTGTGVAHLCGFNIAEGVARVDFSNFTKFVDGKPVYKDGGKVAKGPYWTEADLTGLSGD